MKKLFKKLWRLFIPRDAKKKNNLPAREDYEHWLGI
jgi:hypothetical protein